MTSLDTCGYEDIELDFSFEKQLNIWALQAKFKGHPQYYSLVVLVQTPPEEWCMHVKAAVIQALQRNTPKKWRKIYFFRSVIIQSEDLHREDKRFAHDTSQEPLCMCQFPRIYDICERCHELLRYDGSHVKEDCEVCCPSMSYPAEGIGALKCKQCRQVRQVSTFVLCTTVR